LERIATGRELFPAAGNPIKRFFVAHQTVQFSAPDERTDATNKRVKNRILLSIPDNEFWAMRPDLENVALVSHKILTSRTKFAARIFSQRWLALVGGRAGRREDGGGRNRGEGRVSWHSGACWVDRSPLREVVQITGDGLRMPVSKLTEFLRESPQLRHEMERFSVLLGLQMAQTAGCNRLHGVEQRLARWLLMAQDG